MTTLGHSTTIRWIVLGVLAFAPNSWAQQRAPILEKIAKTYGLDSWDKIEGIRYTWTGEIPGVFKLSRTWEWDPKTTKSPTKGKTKTASPSK